MLMVQKSKMKNINLLIKIHFRIYQRTTMRNIESLRVSFTPPVALGMYEFHSSDHEQSLKRLRTAQPIEDVKEESISIYRISFYNLSMLLILFHCGCLHWMPQILEMRFLDFHIQILALAFWYLGQAEYKSTGSGSPTKKILFTLDAAGNHLMFWWRKGWYIHQLTNTISSPQ